MTAIIGVLCKDGVVIGSDSSATFTAGGMRTIEQKTKKIDIIENSVIVAGTGQVGLGQRFCGIVKEAYTNRLFTAQKYLEVGRNLSQAGIDNFGSTSCAKGQYGALLAYASAGIFYLCEFQVSDFQPEWKTSSMWFVSLGSGQPITDPFLGLMRRVFWKDEMPTVVDAIFAVTWTLTHVIELNPGGINGPPQLAMLRKHPEGREHVASLITDEEIREHLSNVKGAEEYLGKYKEILQGASGATVPSL